MRRKFLRRLRPLPPSDKMTSESAAVAWSVRVLRCTPYKKQKEQPCKSRFEEIFCPLHHRTVRNKRPTPPIRMPNETIFSHTSARVRSRSRTRKDKCPAVRSKAGGPHRCPGKSDSWWRGTRWKHTRRGCPTVDTVPC